MNIVFVTTQSSTQSTLIGRVVPLAKEFIKMGHDVTVLMHREEESSFRPRCAPRLPAVALAKVGSLGEVGSRNPDNVDAGPRSSMTTEAEIKTCITGPNPFERNSSGKKRHSGVRLVSVMIANAVRAAWHLYAVHPDVVIIAKPLPENTLAVLLWKLLHWNTKVIVDVDDFELFANKLASPMQRASVHWSERTATRMASRIIVATPFLMDYMAGLVSHKIPVTVIPTGYSPSSANYVHSDEPVLLYAGSVSTSSGHYVGFLPELLQEVRKQVPLARLLIAGTGDDEELLKQKFQQLQLSDAVTWFGRFSQQDTHELISKSAILIDPIDGSIVSRAKSSFRTMLACAEGMPVVTSNIGIRPMLLPQELHEKFFALPADVKSYAEKIVALIKKPLDQQEKALMQKKSREYAWEKLASQYHACIL